MIKIKKGLDLPISGSPKQEIVDGPAVSEVALLGEDYIGMKPSMKIRLEQRVKCGDVLFTDKKTEGVVYTAPASGTIKAINRGAKRKLLSVVIEVEGDDYVEFDSFPAEQLDSLNREQVVTNLVNSGLWTALRTRPFSKVPSPKTEPAAVFVNAMDTNPLAVDPTLVIAEKHDLFKAGLKVIRHLTRGETFVCHDGSKPELFNDVDGIEYRIFSGVHPAGNVGTHIHFLKPVNDKRSVWHLGYQDVIAIGHLFLKGHLMRERVVSLAGPLVKEPRVIRTVLGASTDQLVANNINPDDERVISGSVFNGHIAVHHRAYLGRYHNQITVLKEGCEKEFFGWLHLGRNKFSVTNAFISHLTPGKKFDFTTSTGGSERALMPIGVYEQVMPWDILPTQLLRAIVTGDSETAQQLGVLEFDEEDLALCTFVCPGKHEFGPMLRELLTTIEKEG